jgi:hypothetical protein
MRYFALVLAILGAATAARAQDAIPDLKGTWLGKGKVIIFGGHAHHPGVPQDSPPGDYNLDKAVSIGSVGRRKDAVSWTQIFRTRSSPMSRRPVSG